MKYLNTYGKQKTQLSAWVSIQDRKQIFDITPDSEADISAQQQASKATRIRHTRKAAKKKTQLLTSEDEENIFLPPNKKTTRRRKPSTASWVPTRKRKLPSFSVSSDEENVPLTRNTKPAITHKKTRRKRSKICSDKNTSEKTPDHGSDENMFPAMLSQNSFLSSDSKAESSRKSRKKNMVQEHKSVQKDSLVHIPSTGRFVTRRKRAISPHPLILNTSDEFSKSRIIGPSHRRCPPSFLESSVDSSVQAPALRSFITVPLRDISLNESAEHNLGSCSRKPIFCSTPSAVPLHKRSKLKHFNATSSPPSLSVSCIGPASTFQADLGSPEQLSSPVPASPSEPFGEKQTASVQKHCQLHNVTSSSGAAHDQCEEGQAQSSSSVPSVFIISSDSSSCFTSATGDLNWLYDVLKEKCLTQICTVRLERLEELIACFSETTYSSCLGDLRSVCSTSAKEHLFTADTSHTSKEFSEPCTNAELVMSTKSVENSNSSVHSVSVTAPQCTEPHQSEPEPEHVSSLELFSEFENSETDIAGMQSHADMGEGLSAIIKNECLSREFSVQLERLSHSSIELHLTPDANQGENDQSKVRQSQQNRPEPQAADKPELKNELKKKCLNSKTFVKMRKMFLTEINYNLQEGIVVLNRNASELVSEQSEEENECAKAHIKETGRCRKRTSASLNERVLSDKNVLKTSSNRQKEKENERKRLTQASKEKKLRTSTHRPATTRKACVSGLSVSRWKNRDAFTRGTGQRGVTKAVDCSINELIPSQHRPVELTDFSKNFSTPLKGSNVNLSSLLDELTPNTHTWSRLKAALSVHRKVILTPKTPGPGHAAPVALADVSRDLFATPFRTPLPKQLRSQLMTHESQLACDDEELSDAEKVYAECGQQGPLPWTECLLPQRMKRCVKIGEGTFGEVFSTTSGKSSEETVALKVIPVEGSEKVNGETQKNFGEILHEIIISKELSCLNEKEENKTSGFIGLRDLHCVRGRYPSEFLKAWDKFDKQKHSENDRPDFFEKEQLFIILEFEFGGTDLENCNGTLPSIVVAKSILHQVTAALAVAERELHFEHRDLHWGNVLVKMTKQKTADFSLNGVLHSLETKGVLVRIIDYSLSRLEIDELTVSCDIAHDEELFMGQGDYQFDIYRLMRQENGNVWSSYNPHSNVLWLHYLCSKLLDMRYRGSGGRRNKDMRDELTSFYDNVLRFSSATEVLQNSSLFQ